MREQLVNHNSKADSLKSLHITSLKLRLNFLFKFLLEWIQCGSSWDLIIYGYPTVVPATAVDSHVYGMQSYSGSLQDLINISCFQSYERVLHMIHF